MGEVALKFHASEIKHKNSVKSSQTTKTVSHFFKVISGVKGEIS